MDPPAGGQSVYFQNLSNGPAKGILTASVLFDFERVSFQYIDLCLVSQNVDTRASAGRAMFDVFDELESGLI
jgi:hypothetical protein